MRSTFDHSDQTNKVEEQFVQLKKISALHPDRLLDKSYLAGLDTQFNSEDARLLVRKEEEIIYKSANADSLSLADLPSFGFTEINLPITRKGKGGKRRDGKNSV